MFGIPTYVLQNMIKLLSQQHCKEHAIRDTNII